MKYALITDTHFGARNDSLIFANFFRRFYEEVFFPTLVERKVYGVIHLVDIVDRRKFINYKTLNTMREIFLGPLNELKIPTSIIIGNHDIYFKNTLEVNAVRELMDGYDYLSYYEEPSVVKLGNTEALILPWICEDNHEKSMSMLEKSRCPVVFGHLHLDGIEHTKGSISTDGFSPSLFKAYRKVFSGHFHHRSITGNIHYLGNPYEMTWADYNDQRGFHIFDTETLDTEFIPNPFSMFHKIYYDDSEGQEPEQDLSRYKDCYVKIIIKNKTNQYMFEALMDGLIKVGVGNISIIDNLFDIEDLGEDLESIEDVEDTMSVIKNCVDSLQITNKGELNKLMQDLYNEALTVETV